MKIGFIGLGIMGSRMAANLQKNGYELIIFNRTRAKAQALLDGGASFAESPAKLAEQVDVVFTMLAHPDAVQEAALGDDGFLLNLRRDALWVDCSSVNPSFTRQMAAAAATRQIRFVDAPVTGSAPVAAAAKLVFWAGADPGDLETIRPLLLSMGDRIVQVGGHGMGTSMKMVVNLLLGINMAAFAEGLALGERLGISRQMLFDSLLGMPAVAPFLGAKRQNIESGTYNAEFPLRWMQKDLDLAARSGQEAGVMTLLADAANHMYRLAIKEGRATQDFSAIYESAIGNTESQPELDPTTGNVIRPTRAVPVRIAA
jgi:3-hydroxyisobutyrate dehydrogenase/glyoxylate/succinic semialdehyde reductase